MLELYLHILHTKDDPKTGLRSMNRKTNIAAFEFVNAGKQTAKTFYFF